MANGDSLMTITAKGKGRFCGKKIALQTYWTSFKYDYKVKQK